MIFNNADNIMYGDKEVDRVFYGKNLVWERGYKWINSLLKENESTYSIVLGYKGLKNPEGEVKINWCNEPYTVTQALKLPSFTTAYANKWIDYHSIAPIDNEHNIFGDKIINTDLDILNSSLEDWIEYDKPANFFENAELYINERMCTKIGDFSFFGRKLKSLNLSFLNFTKTSYLNTTASVRYGCYYIGKYAFAFTTSDVPTRLNLGSCHSNYGSTNEVQTKVDVDAFAFAYSNCVESVTARAEQYNIYSYSTITFNDYSFYSCYSIKTVSIDTVESNKVYFNQYCFAKCLNLNLSKFPGGNHNTYVDSYAFLECGNQCDAFSEIHFSYRYDYGGGNAGNFTTSIEIMSNAFYNCSNIKEIFFGDKNVSQFSVKTSSYAFRNCFNINKIHFNISSSCVFEDNAFKDQVDNNCEFYIYNTSTSKINYIKNALIDCGVPESLIIVNNA